MASSKEFIHFVGEVHPDDDLFEATSKNVGRHSAGPSSGRRWNQWQARQPLAG
ncbi:UNVERIFIED_CONTAM: hypothetical protein Sangu_2544400 [Sesamum angustifolium]|uniref:Uncharacterized protein n=1 Tax=Sesamum angustifolium TaxID=2727405 RepID=A0AAW2J8T5_9LAMI